MGKSTETPLQRIIKARQEIREALREAEHTAEGHPSDVTDEFMAMIYAKVKVNFTAIWFALREIKDN